MKGLDSHLFICREDEEELLSVEQLVLMVLEYCELLEKANKQCKEKINTPRRVKALIAQQLNLDIDQVSLSSRLKTDLNADSMDLVEIVFALEDEFNIEISDAEVERIKTVAGWVYVVDPLKNYTKAQKGGRQKL